MRSRLGSTRRALDDLTCGLLRRREVLVVSRGFLWERRTSVGRKRRVERRTDVRGQKGERALNRCLKGKKASLEQSS